MAKLPEVIHDMEKTRWVADLIVNEAGNRKINQGLIVVASIFNANVALAMRTLDNGGWGYDTVAFTLEQEERIKLAIESTQSAINSRRSASTQREYLAKLGRAVDAYEKVESGFVGRSAYLDGMGMVATFQSTQTEAHVAEMLVLDAVYSSKGFFHKKTFLDALADKLKDRIDGDASSGIVMTSLNRLSKDGDPILLEVQTLGLLNVGIGNVVMSKMRRTINTGEPSEHPYLQGAVPLNYKDSRIIIGVGGLKPDSQDRKLIEECIAENTNL